MPSDEVAEEEKQESKGPKEPITFQSLKQFDCCVNCGKDFDTDLALLEKKRLHAIPYSCSRCYGHSLCHKCRGTIDLQNFQCPLCERKGVFEQSIPNRALCTVLENLRSITSSERRKSKSQKQPPPEDTCQRCRSSFDFSGEDWRLPYSCRFCAEYTMCGHCVRLQKFQKTFQCRTCHANNAFYGVVPNLAVCAVLEAMRNIMQERSKEDSKQKKRQKTTAQSDPDPKLGLQVGQNIHCYWPHNKTFYPGKITKVIHAKQGKGENTYDVSAQQLEKSIF
jgi:hypothetical protein